VGRPEFGSHNWRWQTRLADARVRLASARGHGDEVDQASDELFRLAEFTHARKYLARGLVLRAERYVQRNDLAAAECDLLTAVGHADQMGYSPTRIEARSKLCQLHERTGSAAQAARVRRELSDLIAELGRTLQQPELRRSFEQGIASSISRHS
jgi:hypothetical protein